MEKNLYEFIILYIFIVLNDGYMLSKDVLNKIVIFFVKNMKDFKENLEKRLFKFRNIRNGVIVDDMRG